MVVFVYRMNTRKLIGIRSRPAVAKAMSKRSFNFASEDRIEKLKQTRLKKSCESKIDWAVGAYVDWRNERLENYQYDPAIYFSDLLKLEGLEKENLNHSLCRFIPEVTRKCGEGPFPGATLYQMIVAIQKYLNVNKIKWKLIDGDDFEDTRTVLDNVMQERTAQNIGVVKRQAGIISYEHEESLWQKGVLGEDSPDKLRNTVLFLLGINVCLRAVEEHYYLRRDTEVSRSQLSFVKNPKGLTCVLYEEDCVTKTHDGGLRDMRRDRKIVWIYPNLGNPSRCPVRLIRKYLSLCPAVAKKENFYLQSLQKPTPAQWYGVQVVGQNSISKVVKKLMEDAGIKGFFTNHSARRTGGTRLFRAGVQCKLVKETTGHSSDAIDKYQITSDEQRQMMSEVIAGRHVDQVREVEIAKTEAKKNSDKETIDDVCSSCKSCERKVPKVDASNVGGVVKELIKHHKNDGKTVIKIQIEITSE